MIEQMMGGALRNRVLILLLVLIIIGFGAYSIRGTAIDAFPDVTNIQVEVLCGAPGLSPLEIERFVTYPVETAMRGLPGLVTMRSVTKYGLAVVTIVFQDGTDIYFARQLVHERLAAIESSLPEGVKTEMGPVATAMGEIYQYTIEGTPPTDQAEKIRYLTELRSLQDWVVAPQLKSEPGVNEVNSFGGYLKEYQVIVAPDKLLKYKLSIGDVFEAIKNNNENVGGSFINRASEQYIIRGVGLIGSLEDIDKIIVKSIKGVPIYVGDVAEVRDGYAPRQGSALKDGRGEVVGGIVMMLKGENSLAVVSRVEERVKAINESNLLPPGLTLVPYYDRSKIVGESIWTILRTLAEGVLLVTVVLYLLIMNIRGAIVVVMALPLAILLTFIVMKQAGLSANLMSLGGLAISIGMIIDATIIQVENVQRHLGALRDPSRKLSTVLQSVMEVRRPSIFGELIIALTFLPIITLEGMEGKMFSPLAITVSIALFASLFLSVFITPVLCAYFLKPGAEKRNAPLEWIKRVYLWVLNLCMRMPVLILGESIVLMLAAVLLIPRLGTEFIPVMDEGAFDMDFNLIPGVSLDKAMEITNLIEQRLMKFPEMETLVSRTGQTGVPLEARGVDKTGFVGLLKPKEQWTTAKTREELADKMRDALADIPGMTFTFSQPIQCRIDELVAGTRAQLILKLFGDDLDVLKAKTNEMAKVLGEIQGCEDMVVERVSGQPYIGIRVDRNKIARYGLNVRDVLAVIEIAIGGKAATQVYEGNRAFDLTVRFPEDMRNSIEKLADALVGTSDGIGIPLNQLADIALQEGPVQISRDNGMRFMGIELNIVGRDIGSFVAEAKQKIRQKVMLPVGYSTAWGGQFENQQRAMHRLMIITPLVVILVLVLLFMTFKSVRISLLVFLNLPFALMGGVFTLWLTGTYLSVPASVGFITLLGVAVLNGLVLVSCITQLRGEGRGVREAVREACALRLRPILMTASITVFSLIPMMFAAGPGSEVQRPLAIVVVGGLFTSTLATLLVLPSLYGWFDRNGRVSEPTTSDIRPPTSGDMMKSEV
jgi:cobalt-zinc-cadmium resistance protein CzcA